MTPELLNRFVSIVGEDRALTSDHDLHHYTHENRGLFVGKTPLVLKPASTGEVSSIVGLASEMDIPVVPQGGHTGHVGGAVPDESGTQIVVSLERMNKIREIDLDGDVLVCEAGCILETIQTVASDNNRLFPLALGSQGSCQIGGNISSNAGGTGVIAYGNTRNLVSGLEVVLPSGEIWNGLRRLKKDNTGYDLKNLFIGAEGTLGIVTASVLKLYPKPKGQAVSWCGLDTPEQAISLLNLAKERAASALTTFEVMEATPVEFTFTHMEGVRNPLEKTHPWQVMIEISSSASQEDADAMLQNIMEQALGKDLVSDAALSGSIAQQKDFWRIREMMPVSQKHEGASMKHDVSVPIHLIPEFLRRAGDIIKSNLPEARPCVFGHLGDGNMHYNVSQPVDGDGEVFLERQPEINGLIHELVASMNGSVAAEHGVGRLKRDLIARTKDPIELNMMRQVKQALDPKGIMNPGKVI